MRIERIHGGFIEYLDHEFIEKICCSYDNSCVVHYHDRPPQKLLIECSSYNSQYGYPVSEDGRMLFVGSWENGLMAYDIATNELVWHLQTALVTSIIVYSSYVVAEIYYNAIVKLDIHTGEILSAIRSGTIAFTRELKAPYIIVDRIRGRLAIVDTSEMTVVKAYKNKIVNPNNCGCILIQDYRVNNNALSISGIESYPNQDYKILGEERFTRVIDTNLYEEA